MDFDNLSSDHDLHCMVKAFPLLVLNFMRNSERSTKIIRENLRSHRENIEVLKPTSGKNSEKLVNEYTGKNSLFLIKVSRTIEISRKF